MTGFLRSCLLVMLTAGALLADAPKSSPQPSSQVNPMASMEQKLAYLQKNSLRPHPDPQPTQFTEEEINSFVGDGGVKLPAGVHSVRFEGHPGVVTSYAKVDFDQVRAGSHSANPLLSIFSGLHDVVIVAQGEATHGEAAVHVDSVSLDGVEVPNFVLALFVEKFITPKHPNLGIDSRIRLPERIDTATVGAHRLIVRQK
jgi:hypothetical protein